MLEKSSVSPAENDILDVVGPDTARENLNKNISAGEKILGLEAEIESKLDEIASIEDGIKVEWGENLGQMSWYNASEKIRNLNERLGKGEKPWRLPTKFELVVKIKKDDLSHNSDLGIGTHWTCEGGKESFGSSYTVSNRLGERFQDTDNANAWPYAHCVR